MVKIAVVEDDIYLRCELIQTFKKNGYDVFGISEFENTEKILSEISPDLVILDVNLPGKSGYDICRYLKARTAIPILILTARNELTDELTALGLGADDFLTKPCHPDRLIARAERLLQTYNKIKGIIQAGELTLDVDTYKLVYRENSLILSETEGKIIKSLIENYPNTVSKKELFNSVWGTEEFVDENILQVNMTRLRKSLSEAGITELVKTVRGQGYLLAEL